MKFGPVPTETALGAILAHSVSVGDTGELRLRKGITLTQKEIDLLLQAGIEEVSVARLGPHDLDENTAATRVAEALVEGCDELRLSNAGTGRVNIFAKAAGVTRVDAAKIHALNAIDPMITVATAPPYARAAKGQMIATVKIISYGVAESHIAEVADIAVGGLGLETPVYSTACMIETVGQAKSDKGFEATRARVETLGVHLTRGPRIDHNVEAISEALQAAKQEVLLILTASATSDIDDIAPTALKQAGGKVTCYGMPVDPGNLLFFGTLGPKPVIGLPGCARSPALNGADWVLERLLCGIDVTQSDISKMGVGGLLKEIPTRPHPRSRTESE
ncbi:MULTISPECIES: molybdopterin-binding protein [Halocynthiibacter]|uniref:Molybdopterin-binding protein n=1 Tax=Halocynthiibacter halioticoli TaxID=2986804 RepID=A0AAE3J177_9RHOB|nr:MULTISPECIES: molybdopterin-binding protein [Halocynthiibacter]MCV6824648.1 molybdopterin-binding protein [Halocynthiibacter halioticoli]MCW4057649.1 molybdopterin-binding protein [Halocynthiibacter sp. SDUM655004]